MKRVSAELEAQPFVIDPKIGRKCGDGKGQTVGSLTPNGLFLHLLAHSACRGLPADPRREAFVSTIAAQAADETYVYLRDVQATTSPSPRPVRA